MLIRRELLLLPSAVLLACSSIVIEDTGTMSAGTSGSSATSGVAATGTGDMTTPGTTVTSTATSDESATGALSATSTSTSTTTTSGGSTTDAATSVAATGGSSGGMAEGPPPLGPDACKGYATRYWDCCKAHCGWKGNVNPQTEPVQSCDKADQSLGPNYDVVSACQQPADKSAFTCYNMAPWTVSPTLAYGFAAVPAMGDICGRCYQLEFDGTGHYNAQDPGSVALKGKTMIVQASNIGFDVGGGQFDVLTPGGGVGAFDACSFQWNVNKSELGATYGGFMSYCQQQGGDFAAIKQCVLSRCTAVFDEPNMADLLAGCQWYVGWYEAADNPNLKYQEVACPPELVALSGIDRGPLNDIGMCMGGAVCSQQEMDNCDCAWTNGGQNCGQDDGSCCWTACCA